MSDMVDVSGTSSHHERFDGAATRKPVGRQIPFYSRIVAVADAWDAITNPVRIAALSLEEAAEPRAQAGSQFVRGLWRFSGAGLSETGRGEAAMSMEWRMLMKTIEIRTSCDLNSFPFLTLWLKWLGRAASTAESVC